MFTFFLVSQVSCYQSNYQQWNFQTTRNTIQSRYSNNDSDSVWLGILDPLNSWISTYSGDNVMQQLIQQGITSKIAKGMASLLSSNPEKINNKVSNIVKSTLPKPDIAKIIVDEFYNNGYKGAIIDGATNILSSSWSTDNTNYNMVTLMSIMSDESETDSNLNGFFVADSQTRKTIGNLAYASQVMLEKQNLFSLRQPIVLNATYENSDATNPVNFANGAWNYTNIPDPAYVWGYTLNVPIGSITFASQDASMLLDRVSFNITSASGQTIQVDDSAILGASTDNVPSCQRSTKVNTHIYNPSAMGTGLWASNGYGLIFGDCPMAPDYTRAVHGQGTPCTEKTYIIYKNNTDGLLSFVIPSLSSGNWVVKPADGLLKNTTLSKNACINSLTSVKNQLLNIIQPPVSPTFIDYFEECADFVTFNDTVNGLTNVIIEYAGPSARYVPDNPISNYNQLLSCINASNVPGEACFDPGLSRSTVEVCKEYLPSSIDTGNASLYNTVTNAAISLQQKTANTIVQTPTSTYIPDVVGAPTAYGAVTAFVAAVAAAVALDAGKILHGIQTTWITRTTTYKKQTLITMFIVLFAVLFAQLPMVILCIQAVKLDGKTGYQYVSDYTTTTDNIGKNVFLVLQVSAIKLTYNVPIFWLYPTILCISCVVCSFLCVAMYMKIR